VSRTLLGLELSHSCGLLSGLIPADDAPDIVANTFLAALPDETLRNIRYGFLEHRERE